MSGRWLPGKLTTPQSTEISVSCIAQPQTGRLHHAPSPRLRSQRRGGGEIARASEEEGGTEDVSGHPREAESVNSQVQARQPFRAEGKEFMSHHP